MKARSHPCAPLWYVPRKQIAMLPSFGCGFPDKSLPESIYICMVLAVRARKLFVQHFEGFHPCQTTLGFSDWT
jgi:hypothetical protein